MRKTLLLFFIFAGGMWLLTFSSCSHEVSQPPNLLFVFTDQQRKQAIRFMKEDPYQLHPETVSLESENQTMMLLDRELGEWLVRMHDPFPLE